VVARRIAETLRRKSTANGIGPYFLKNNCLDCNADQRITAAFVLISTYLMLSVWSLQELLQ
jgi:hypothetical protein